jgi:hypothetical protein
MFQNLNLQEIVSFCLPLKRGMPPHRHTSANRGSKPIGWTPASH